MLEHMHAQLSDYLSEFEMKWLLVLSLLVWANQPTRATEESCSLGTHSTSYPLGDMRNCELSTNDGPAYRMEVSVESHSSY